MLFVARHGETEWNMQDRVCGITDVALTDKGREQAKQLAYDVKSKNVSVIISSPLIRAVETSKIVSEICNVPIEIDARLVEQNYGIYEGIDRNDDNFLENKRNFAYKYPNGESMMQVAYRVYGLIDEIKARYKGMNVLIISHGGVCRVINTYFKDMTNEDFFNYRLKNGNMEEYEL